AAFVTVRPDRVPLSHRRGIEVDPRLAEASDEAAVYLADGALPARREDRPVRGARDLDEVCGECGRKGGATRRAEQRIVLAGNDQRGDAERAFHCGLPAHHVEYRPRRLPVELGRHLAEDTTRERSARRWDGAAA